MARDHHFTQIAEQAAEVRLFRARIADGRRNVPAMHGAQQRQHHQFAEAGRAVRIMLDIADGADQIAQRIPANQHDAVRHAHDGPARVVIERGLAARRICEVRPRSLSATRARSELPPSRSSVRAISSLACWPNGGAPSSREIRWTYASSFCCRVKAPPPSPSIPFSNSGSRIRYSGTNLSRTFYRQFARFSLV